MYIMIHDIALNTKQLTDIKLFNYLNNPKNKNIIKLFNYHNYNIWK